MEFYDIRQADLKLLTSGDLPTSAFQSAEVTAMSHHTIEGNIDLSDPDPMDLSLPLASSCLRRTILARTQCSSAPLPTFRMHQRKGGTSHGSIHCVSIGASV